MANVILDFTFSVAAVIYLCFVHCCGTSKHQNEEVAVFYNSAMNILKIVNTLL